jgi:hypothetical protein
MIQAHQMKAVLPRDRPGLGLYTYVSSAARAPNIADRHVSGQNLGSLRMMIVPQRRRVGKFGISESAATAPLAPARAQMSTHWSNSLGGSHE